MKVRNREVELKRFYMQKIANVKPEQHGCAPSLACFVFTIKTRGILNLFNSTSRFSSHPRLHSIPSGSVISAKTVAGMLAKVSFLNTLTCNFVNKLVQGSVSGMVYSEFCFSRSQGRVSMEFIWRSVGLQRL